MKSSKTSMIKSKFSNAVHKLLEPNIGIPKKDRWKHKQPELTPTQRLELFDKIVALHNECSSELGSYLYKRRESKRVQRLRQQRGYVSKHKTTLKEWIAKQNSVTA